MSVYQFHFIGLGGDRPALDFVHCSDDGDAAREAMSQLGQHGSALGVEVWEGNRLVIRMERSPSEVLPVGAALLGARGLAKRSASTSISAAFKRPQR